MGNTYQTMPLDPTTNYLKYGQKFPPTQMTYDQTSNNVAAINQRNDLSQLNDLINLSNADLDNNFISTLTSIFHVGDTIIIYINRNVFHSFKFKHSWSKFVKIYVKIVGIKHTF